MLNARFWARSTPGKAYCCGMSRHQRKEGNTLNLKGVGYIWIWIWMITG